MRLLLADWFDGAPQSDQEEAATRELLRAKKALKNWWFARLPLARKFV